MPSVEGAPRPHTDDWEWQLQGACRSFDPELFFPPSNERGRTRAAREQRAKAVCATCPVLALCREHALRSAELFGVWGGLTEEERSRLRRRPAV